MISAINYTNIKKDILPCIRGFKTSYEIMQKLKALYSKE